MANKPVLFFGIEAMAEARIADIGIVQRHPSAPPHRAV